jgi:hypothetical protein
MNETFIVDDHNEVRRADGVTLTGWESVIFELEDDPGYDGVFGSDS